MTNEHQFDHEEDGKIEYHEEGGKLWYSWYDEIDWPKQYSSSFLVRETAGIIPNSVITQGKRAIKAYAKRKVDRYLKEVVRKVKEKEEKDRNRNLPIKVRHRGVILRGRITSTEDNTLQVRLDKPYQGEDFVVFGFASAVLGRNWFDEQGNLTTDAITTAEGLIKGVYDEQRHKKENKGVIDLATRLNQ